MAKQEIINVKEIMSGIVNGLKEVDVNGKKSIMYCDTYNANGTIEEFKIANPTTAKWASVLKITDGLEYAIGLKKAFACYYLKEHFDEYKGEKFTSFSKCIDTIFPSISSKTAEEYALVGQYFLKCENPESDDMKVEYRHELLEGASVTNMKQCLSFIDKDSDNPLHNILDYIAEGRLNITGTLTTVKKNKDDINADLGKGKKRSKVDKKSKSTKDDNEITVASVIKFMSDYAETHETKKDEIVSIIEKIESIFNEE